MSDHPAIYSRRQVAVALAGLCAAATGAAQSPGKFVATKAPVANRGSAPDSFLQQLLDWGRTAPQEVFAPNAIFDIYSSVAPQLGPYQGLAHRRAVMLEVLRVHAGFESSWNWDEGRDLSNQESNTPATEEAGAFQCSCNSLRYGQELKDLFARASPGDDSCEAFIRVSKQDHPFAIEYDARLLRRTLAHHGPIHRREVNRWLRRDAVAEFQSLLARGA